MLFQTVEQIHVSLESMQKFFHILKGLLILLVLIQNYQNRQSSYCNSPHQDSVILCWQLPSAPQSK